MKSKKQKSSTMSVITECLKILPRTDRIKLILISALQAGLAILDLLGVALIGLIGALTVSGIQSRNPSSGISLGLELLRIDNLDFQTQIITLALIASFILVSRTILSIYFIRRIFFFLSIKGAQISSDLVAKFMKKDYAFIKKFPPQESLYGLTSGVQSITVGVLGNAVALFADFTLLTLLVVGLFLANPVIALCSIGIFGSLAGLLYWRFNSRAESLGKSNAFLSVQSDKQILQTLSLFREISVGNHFDFFINGINRTRVELADSTAELQYLPYISKYVIEMGIVIGALIVSGIQFLMLDAEQAIATLAIFIAASTRIAPSILRLQQSGISLRSKKGSAAITFGLIRELASAHETAESHNSGLQSSKDFFVPRVELSNVNYSHASGQTGVEGVSLAIEPGEQIAIVGPSGAGKTTLVELILGLVQPDGGSILLSDMRPRDALRHWPGQVAYIPQEIAIVDVSLAENIAVGLHESEIDIPSLWRAIEISQLNQFVLSLSDGLKTKLGDFGGQLSGGQRQRIGIARAIYGRPKLIVMDESTSALDGQTESEVTRALLDIGEGVTLITIAHRLSTVRNANRVIYMEKGRLVATGTFDEVRAVVPDFDRQAQLMGL